MPSGEERRDGRHGAWQQVALSLCVAVLTFGTTQFVIVACGGRPSTVDVAGVRSTSTASPRTAESRSVAPAASSGVPASASASAGAERTRRELRQLDARREAGLRSVQDSPGESDVVVVNASRRTVKCYWIDWDGNRQIYETLAPGESVELETYVGHPWVVTDGADRALFVFQPTREPGIVTVG